MTDLDNFVLAIKQQEIAPTDELESEILSLYEKLKKAEERFNKGVFVKCKLPECFPEHKYIEKEDIFYCERLDIGEVNWDYLYNTRSDSWEVVSNQAFSTKEVAEEYLQQNQKSQEDIEKIKKYDELQKLIQDPKTNAEKVKQIAWWKQNDYSKSIKPMDKMPISEIVKLYESGFIICDTCSKKLPMGECKYSILEHVLHMINDKVLWSCEGCYLEAKRKGRIIGET